MREIKSSDESYNRETASLLWQKSMELTSTEKTV
jgi:hypothetical protein